MSLEKGCDFPQELLRLALLNSTYHYSNGGTRWRSCLRHCATRRKVAGSIPDIVIEIFHLHNPSGRNMALGLTQPLTRNEHQEYFLGINAAGA